MPSIRISEAEVLDAELIKAFEASEQGSPEGTARETVLTITRTDGQSILLRSEMADAALAILRLHGF